MQIRDYERDAWRIVGAWNMAVHAVYRTVRNVWAAKRRANMSYDEFCGADACPARFVWSKKSYSFHFHINGAFIITHLPLYILLSTAIVRDTINLKMK